MPTPQLPSAFRSQQVDSPLVQDADYRLNAKDRAFIDDQIRAIQEYLVIGAVGGIIATWVLVDASSPALAVGDVVTSIGSVAGIPTVTRATTAALLLSPGVDGIVLAAAPPGGKTIIAVYGILPRSITQLSPGPGQARVNTTTGRAQNVASYTTGDFPLGPVDVVGNLTLSRQAGAILATPGVYFYQVASTSASAPAGYCVCATSADPPQVTLATASAAAAAFSILGVSLDPIAPNTFIRVVVESIVPKSVTSGTLAGASGLVRLNATTGAMQVVAAYVPQDYPVGGSNNGVVTLVRGLAVGASAPFDFPSAPGLVDQFDANTASVGSWASIVGTNVVTQATGGNRPTILTADLNGRNAVSFNGTNQWMESSSWSMSTSTEWTCYAVMAMTGTDSAAGGVIIGSTGGGGTRVSLRRDNGGASDNGQYRVERTGAAAFPTNGITYPADMRAAGYRIVAFQARSDGTNEVWIDGTSRGTWTNSDAPCYTILTIGRYQGGILYSTFKISYWLNYNSRHDVATVANVHAKLRAVFPSLP